MNIKPQMNKGKRSFEVSGVQRNGAFHSLGSFYSTSERGAKMQAKDTYGDRYKVYTAFPS